MSRDIKKEYEIRRNILKSNWMAFPDVLSDQEKGIMQPDIQKAHLKNSKVIELIDFDHINLGNVPYRKVVRERESRRKFNKDFYMTIDELSFLLWTTQGVRKIESSSVFRTVPSAGNRHSIETYIYVDRVKSIDKGLYRYLPLDNKLCFIYNDDNVKENLSKALFNQGNDASVFFIWSTIPYRMEWRYNLRSHKLIAIDVGHICQNLYLSCEATNYGTVAIGAYDQKKLDEVLKVDGYEEFAIYCAPVGKYREPKIRTVKKIHYSVYDDYKGLYILHGEENDSLLFIIKDRNKLYLSTKGFGEKEVELFPEEVDTFFHKYDTDESFIFIRDDNHNVNKIIIQYIDDKELIADRVNENEIDDVIKNFTT